MSNRKFKVGDKVKIVDTGDKFSWCDAMNDTIGKIGTVAYDKETGLLEVNLQDEDTWWYYDESNLALVCEPPVKTQANANTNELTQRDLQVLSTVLKYHISYYEDNITCTKEQIEHCFEFCDPEDASTSSWFDSLNLNKNTLRYLRNRKNKLAEIQRKIKRQIANG